jgi:hypothetical protein
VVSDLRRSVRQRLRMQDLGRSLDDSYEGRQISFVGGVAGRNLISIGGQTYPAAFDDLAVGVQVEVVNVGRAGDALYVPKSGGGVVVAGGGGGGGGAAPPAGGDGLTEAEVLALVDATKGLSVVAGKIRVNLAADSGLGFDGGGALTLDLVTNSGLILSSAGVGIDLVTDSGLILNSSGLGIDLATTSGLVIAATGLALDTPDDLSYLSATSAVTASGHTHAVISSFDVGTVQGPALLRSTSLGGLTLASLTLKGNLAFSGADRVISATNKLSITTTSSDLFLNPYGVISYPDSQESRTVVFTDTPGGIRGFQLADWSTIPFPPGGGLGANAMGLKLNYLKVDNLFARKFTADEVRVQRGEWWLTRSFGIVETDFTVPEIGSNVDVWFEEAVGLDGAKLFLKDNWIQFRTIDMSAGLVIQSIYFQVVDADGTGLNDYIQREPQDGDKVARQQWRLKRKSGGFTGTIVRKGDVGADQGQPEHYEGATLIPAQGVVYATSLFVDNGPFIQTQTFEGLDATLSFPIWKLRTRMGNLRSTVDYTYDTYGFAAGDDLSRLPSDGFSGFAIDKDQGARMFNTDIRLYDSGALSALLARDYGLVLLNDLTMWGSEDRNIAWYDDLTPFDAGGALDAGDVTARIGSWGNSTDRRLQIYSGGVNLAGIFLEASGDSGSDAASLTVKGGGWYAKAGGVIQLNAHYVTMVTADDTPRFRVGGDVTSFAKANLHVYAQDYVNDDSVGILVEAAGGSDAMMHWQLAGGGQQFVAGIDRTDGNFKIEPGNHLGTGTPAIVINPTTGVVTINGLVGNGTGSLTATGGDGIDLVGTDIRVDGTVVRTNRTITGIAGGGLSGGGALSSNLTFSVDNTVVRNTFRVDTSAPLFGGGALNSNLTLGLDLAAYSGLEVVSGLALAASVAGTGLTMTAQKVINIDADYALPGHFVTAGNGLSGGGQLTTNPRIDVEVGLGLWIDTIDRVALAPAVAGTGLIWTAGVLSVDPAYAGGGSDAGTLNAGDGLNITSTDLAVGPTISVDPGVGIALVGTKVTLASSVAGDGLIFTAGVLDVVGGHGIVVGADVSLSPALGGDGLDYAAGVLSLSTGLAGDGLVFSAPGVLKVGAGDGITVGADAIAVAPGLGIELLTATVAVKLASPNSGLNRTSGLQVGAGAAISVSGGLVAVALATPNSGLNTSSGLAVGAGSGISVAAGLVAVDATVVRSSYVIETLAAGALAGGGALATPPGKLSLSVLLAAASGLVKTANGLAVGAGDGIQVDTASVTVKLPSASGLLKAPTGLVVDVATLAGPGLGFNATTKVINVNATSGVKVGLGVDADNLVVDPEYDFVWNGTHEFNADPQIDANLDFIGGVRNITSPALINLGIVPGGDLVLDPAGLNVLPGTGGRTDLGDYNRKWGTLYARELYVETLVASSVMATIGGRIMVTPTTSLIADVTPGQSTIAVKHAIGSFAGNTYLYLETAPGNPPIPQIEAMRINNTTWGNPPYYNSGTGLSTPVAVTIGGVDGFQYPVTRGLNATGAKTWLAGDAVVSLGTNASDGYIDLSSVHTVKPLPGGTQKIGPTISIYSRSATTAWDSLVPTVTMGNLTSFVDYATTRFGFAAGNDLTLLPSSGFSGFTADRVAGLRMFNTAVQLFSDSNLILIVDKASGISFERGSSNFNTIGWYSELGDGLTPLDPAKLLGTVGVQQLTMPYNEIDIIAAGVAGSWNYGAIKLRGQTAASVGYQLWIDPEGLFMGTVSGPESANVASFNATEIKFIRPLVVETIRALDASGLFLQDDGGNLGIFIEDGGYVGIGTSTPSNLLHVVQSITDANAIHAVVNASSVIAPYGIVISNTDQGAASASGLRLDLAIDTGSIVRGSAIYTVKEKLFDGTVASRDASLVFLTSQNGVLGEPMRLTSDNRVVINSVLQAGTASGLSLQDDAGNIFMTMLDGGQRMGFFTSDLRPNTSIYRTINFTPTAYLMAGAAVTGFWLADNVYYDGGWKYRTAAAGSVFVQNGGVQTFTVAPSAGAVVDGAASMTTAFRINNDGSISAAALGAVGIAGLRLEDDGGNLGIMIEDGGYVGVGISNPAHKLHVSTAEVDKNAIVANINNTIVNPPAGITLINDDVSGSSATGIRFDFVTNLGGSGRGAAIYAVKELTWLSTDVNTRDASLVFMTNLNNVLTEGMRLNSANLLTLAGGLSAAGAVTLSSTLNVTGAVTLSSTLNVTGGANLSTLGVAGASTLGQHVEIITGTAGPTLTLGSTQLENTNTTRRSRLSMMHFTAGEETIALMHTLSSAADTQIVIGGGFNYNAATMIDFNIGATPTTLQGTRRGRFDATGLLVTGALDVSGIISTNDIRGRVAGTVSIVPLSGTDGLSISDTGHTTAIGDFSGLKTVSVGTAFSVGNVFYASNLSSLYNCYVYQNSATGTKPALMLGQADLSEEFIEFSAAIGAGNPIETRTIAPAATTHKVRVSINGTPGYLYIYAS